MLLQTLVLILLTPQTIDSERPDPPAWPPIQVEVGGSYDIIRGDSDWQDTWVRIRQPIPPRSALYTTLLHARRWGETDIQLRGGAEFPLGEGVSGHLTGSYSPTHEFLAHWGIGGDLGIALGDGWSTGVGGGLDRYRNADVTHQFGRIGWRGGDWGVGYRLGAAQIVDRSGFDHTASVTRYYGGGSHVSLRGRTGDAVVAGPRAVRIDPLNGIGIAGFHLLRPGFGFAYDVGIDEFGGYTRTRLQTGFRIL